MILKKVIVMNENIKYSELQKHFKDKGYTLEQLCIDEMSEIVTTFSLAKGTIGRVLDIRCPSRYKIFILGKNQLPEDTNSKTVINHSNMLSGEAEHCGSMLSADINAAHTLKVRFADSNNDEIDPDTRIRIKRVKPSEAIMMVAHMLYKDITITDYQKEPPHKIKSDDKWYRFNQSILVNGAEHLDIEVINPDKTIDSKNVKLALDIDFWEEE